MLSITPAVVIVGLGFRRKINNKVLFGLPFKSGHIVNITQQIKIEDNRRKVKKTTYGLVFIYFMTFLSGFLQATIFNFLNYLFFLLLFIGGVVLIKEVSKQKASIISQAFLYLTGISALIQAILFVGYKGFRLLGNEELETFIESLLYLITLFYWLTTIVSLVSLRK